MKINPKYKDRIITLPGAQVLDNIKEATERDMKVLVVALSVQDPAAEEIAKAIGITKDEVKESLLFWKDKGAISVTGLRASSVKAEPRKAAAEEEEKAEEPKIQLALISYGIPTYTTEEVDIKLKKSKELRSLVDECNNLLGKIMNYHEAGVIVALYDYLRLSPEYIMLLCSHCAAQGKTTLHYIKKTAENLVSDGITEYSELESYYKKMESIWSTEGKIRRMFGMGSRALTAKEKEAIKCWTEWDVPDKMLKKAYDITVENTSDPNIKYMHKVVSNWHENGIRTPDEADEASKKYRKTNPPKQNARKTVQNGAGSFDTKEFFEAALKRSYTDNQ